MGAKKQKVSHPDQQASSKAPAGSGHSKASAGAASKEPQQTQGTPEQVQAKDPLQELPAELLHDIIMCLSPSERQPLRQCSRYICEAVNKTADTLTVCNDMAQFILQAEREASTKQPPAPLAFFDPHAGTQRWEHSNKWVEQLMLKFPNVKYLDIKCSQQALTTFARHLVRDVIKPQSRLDRNLVHLLAENVRTNSRRHSAVLLCELLKHRAAELVGMRGTTTNFVDPKHATDHQARIWRECVELVDTVLQLKGNTEAKNHEQFKYARDTLDDTLLELACCLQAKHSKFSYALLSKAADPAKAARGWRWLFYCLAQQRQAEAAIEAYKIVDKQTLNTISPTCLSELFRSLIENEITTQPEAKLRAITSESGSWTKFLYRGTTTLTSVQSREGALEKICIDLICKGFYATCLNVINRFETEATSMEVWQQLMGANGLAGGSLPLRQWSYHDFTPRIDKLLELIEQILPNRRTACYKEIMEALVLEGMLDKALELLNRSGLVGGLDRLLYEAVARAYALRETPAGLMCRATVTMLLGIAQLLRDPAVKSEVIAVVVSCYAAKGNLQAAVEMAETSPAAPADEAAGAVDEAAGHPHAPGGANPNSSAPVSIHSRMWHCVAAAAVQRGEQAPLIKSLPHLAPRWLTSNASLVAAAAGEVSDVASTATANSEATPSVWQQIVSAMVTTNKSLSSSLAPAAGSASASTSASGSGEEQLPSALDTVLALTSTHASFDSATYQRDILRATARALLGAGRSQAAITLARRFETKPVLAGHLLAPVLPTLLNGSAEQREQAITQAVWLGDRGGYLPLDTVGQVIDTLVQAGRLAEAVTVSRTAEQEDESLSIIDEGMDRSLTALCDGLLAKGMTRACIPVARRITSDLRCATQLLKIAHAALEAGPAPDLPLALEAANAVRPLPEGQQEAGHADVYKQLSRACLDNGRVSESYLMLWHVQDAHANNIAPELWSKLVKAGASEGLWEVARGSLNRIRDDAMREEMVRFIDGLGPSSLHSRASSREPETGADGDVDDAAAFAQVDAGVVQQGGPGAGVGAGGAAAGAQQQGGGAAAAAVDDDEEMGDGDVEFLV